MPNAIVISGATLGTTQPNAPTGLTTATAFDGVQLDWVNPTNTPIDYIQIASSTTNNVAAGFTTVANVKTTAFYDHSTSGGTRYYWVRAVSTLGNIGPWNAADTAGTIGTPQEVTITTPVRGNLVVYDGSIWANTNEIIQSTSGNAATTISRETTSTTARTTARVRKSLTSGTRTDGDGPNLVWSYTDSTGGYDYGGMRFRYFGSGFHDLIGFTSTDTSNAFGSATTLFTIGANTAVFGGGVQSTNATNGMGYATGAGSTVTQLTSKSTAVTINTPTGAITSNSATLNTATTVSFTVNNTSMSSTDAVVVNIASGASSVNNYFCWAGAFATNSFQIAIRNVTGSNLSETLVIRYAIIKSADA